MQHSIILRAAWALSASLILIAAAFAWTTNQRERHIAAQAASAPPTASAAAPDPAAQRAAAVAVWEQRCAKCHEVEEMPDWLATQPGDKASAMSAFLAQHGKSPQDESARLAAWFAAHDGF